MRWHVPLLLTMIVASRTIMLRMLPAALVGLILACLAQSCLAGERDALVIGNAHYDEGPLTNPANDADLMAAALEGLGFNVMKRKDLDKKAMDDALVQFSDKLTKDSVALFFYAGHGIQVKGENYLVPIHARIRKEFEVADESMSVAKVLRALEDQSRLHIVVLDCCRNNPLERSWRRSGSSRGLAPVADIPQGTLIAYSTAPNTEAADGDDANSPYTQALARVLRSRPAEGLELVDVFREPLHPRNPRQLPLFRQFGTAAPAEQSIRHRVVRG